LKKGIQRDKLERSLGGIANMKKIPDMIFIVDTNVEELAVKEALKLNIPIVAIVDTNSNPSGIDFPIPGNDDARRAINLYCELVKQTILDAQKNVSKVDDGEKLIKSKNDALQNKEKIEENKPEKLKKDKPQKKEKTVKKISKSILSKVKSLTAKKVKK